MSSPGTTPPDTGRRHEHRVATCGSHEYPVAPADDGSVANDDDGHYRGALSSADVGLAAVATDRYGTVARVGGGAYAGLAMTAGGR
jgi:hypothetical protein